MCERLYQSGEAQGRTRAVPPPTRPPLGSVPSLVWNVMKKWGHTAVFPSVGHLLLRRTLTDTSKYILLFGFGCSAAEQ